jgi:hypothetical protein
LCRFLLSGESGPKGARGPGIAGVQIGRIKVILARDADERE